MPARPFANRPPATRPFATLTAAAILLATTACGAPGAAVAALPEGETALSCAALIYSANELVGDGRIADADGTIKGRYLGVMTGLTTKFATEEQLDSTEALARVKLLSFKMTGKTGASNDLLSPEAIDTRARACIG